MIKATILICEVLCFVLALMIAIRLLKPQRKSVSCLVLCISAFALLSHQMMQVIPLLHDEISLTALDQKNEESRGPEVDLNHIRADNRLITVFDITEGSWYSISGRYSWRPAEDTRWDGSASDSITLRIPVGWERTIHFHSNSWRGYVQISDPNHHKEILDTYSEEAGIVTYAIGKSDQWKLLLNGALQILIYTLSLSLLTFMFIFVTHHSKEGGE